MVFTEAAIENPFHLPLNFSTIDILGWNILLWVQSCELQGI